MGSGQVTYSGEVTAPELVVISPGVQVIADYDEPIFYSENYYWRMDGGTWYRSHDHTRGWARVDVVPVTIRSIDRPSAYVHYRAEARGNARQEHREDVRQEHQEQKQERQEHQQEQKQERQEQKQERQEDRREHKNEHADDKRDHDDKDRRHAR
jgi:hypothetical protein